MAVQHEIPMNKCWENPEKYKTEAWATKTCNIHDTRNKMLDQL